MKNPLRDLALVALAAFFMNGAAKAQPAPGAPMIPDLSFEQRSDWINVKTGVTPPAKGDGIADDTDALQAAFRMLKSGKVLYLPPGTYRITRTLELGETGFANAAIYGHGRSTRIVWDGDRDASMIEDLGATGTNLIGFVLDGAGRAGTGLQHSETVSFGTDMLCRHLAFLNLTGNGVSVGYPIHKSAGTRREGLETAETVFDNCLFENCFRGMYIGEYNDYDFVFQGCEFRDCLYGIEDNYGCDYIRDCHFDHDRIVDIQEHSCHSSAVWRCTSYGSGVFLDFSTPCGPYVVQDCNIDSWCDRRGAILLNGAPIAIADCTLGEPSTSLLPEDLRVDHPIWPVKILGKEDQRVVLSDTTFALKGNVLPLTRKDVLGDSGLAFDCGRVYEIPPGVRTGCLLKSAQQSFLQSAVPVPGQIFDAKRDFGAKGDGATDDTGALEQTITAARAAGNGAMAYLPAGEYRISRTLEIGGSNWSLAGTAVVASRISWGGAPGGTVLHVQDADHVTIENLGCYSNGENGEDILQTSTGTKPSFVTYDRVYVYDPSYDPKTAHPAEHYRKRGLHFQGLKATDTVLVTYVGGNTHVEDSAAATILYDVLSGPIVVEGKSKARGGFLGVLTKFSSGENPCMFIKDSNSFVASDVYMEGTPSNLEVSGNPGQTDPPGRVTVQAAKYTRGGTWSSQYPTLTSDNYSGNVNIVFSPVADANQRFDFGKGNPISVLLLGDYFCDPIVKGATEPNVKFQSLANEGYRDKIIHYQLPMELQDGSGAASASQAAGAFDDLQQLGLTDLRINHPDVLK